MCVSFNRRLTTTLGIKTGLLALLFLYLENFLFPNKMALREGGGFPLDLIFHSATTDELAHVVTFISGGSFTKKLHHFE